MDQGRSVVSHHYLFPPKKETGHLQMAGFFLNFNVSGY